MVFFNKWIFHIPVIIITAIVFFIFKDSIFDKGDKYWIELISFISAFASILGIIIVYIELYFAKKEIDNIKTFTQKIKNEITRDMFISDLQRTIEMVRLLNQKYNEEHFEVCVFLLESLHELLNRIKQYSDTKSLVLDKYISDFIFEIPPLLSRIHAQNAKNKTANKLATTKVLEELSQKLMEFKLKQIF